jgi:hypothetical protein
MLHLSHVILSYHSTLLLFIVKHTLALHDIKEIWEKGNDEFEVEELHVSFTDSNSSTRELGSLTQYLYYLHIWYPRMALISFHLLHSRYSVHSATHQHSQQQVTYFIIAVVPSPKTAEDRIISLLA